jgi:predicted MFS family arabinose efflux permease
LSLVLGTAAAIEQPARLAFVVDVVGKEDLSNAVALNSSASNVARIIGPAIAGVVIAAVGEAMCFFVNGISYLAVILALFAIRLAWKPKKKGALQLTASLKDGYLYLKSNRIIQELLLVVSLASFLTIPYITLMPVFARDILQVGSEGLGYLMTAVGIGAILGALLVARQHAGKRGKWLMISNLLGPVFLVIFCFSRLYYLSLLMVVIVGASNAIRLTLGNSLTQLNTADEYHGRMMSIFNLLFNGMSRLGALAIGGLAEVISISWALGISAAVSALLAVIMLTNMSLARKLP